MGPRTRMNGGNATPQEVADAWHKEAHDFGWSQSGDDTWAVEFAKKMKAARLKEGDVKPDPRNIHDS
jgi:hypothetical protein